MNDDWIDKIIAAKKEQRESGEALRKEQMERQKVYDVHAPELFRELSDTLSKAIDVYNSKVVGSDRVQYKRMHADEFNAHKGELPAGDLTVRLSDDRGLVIFTSRYRDRQGKSSSFERNLSITLEGGRLRIVGYEQPNEYDQIAKEMLSDFFKNI